MNMESKRKNIYITVLGIIVFLLFGNFYIHNMLKNAISPDVLWRYVNSKNIADGLVPYKDFNLLQMPLSYYLFSLIFHFTDRLSVFVICESFLYLLDMFLICRLIRKAVNADMGICLMAFVLCMLILYTVNPAFSILQADMYDGLSVFFFLCTISSTQKGSFWAKIFSVLCFYSKQTIGVFCFLYVIIYLVSENKKIWNYVIGYVIVHLLFFEYACIYIRNAKEMIEYCFLGISSFDRSKNSLIYLGVAVVILAIYIIAVKKLKIERNRYAVILFALLMLFNAYPLINYPHLCYALVTIMTYLLADFFHMFVTDMRPVLKDDVMKPFFAVLAVVLSILVISFKPYEIQTRTIEDDRFKDCSYVLSYGEYKQEDYIGQAEKLSAYADRHKDMDIICLDKSGVLYSILQNRYDRYYTMFLDGNLGNKTMLDVLKMTKEKYIAFNKKFVTQFDKRAENYIKQLPVVDETGWYQIHIGGDMKRR